jgi:hypothetical protein
MSHAKTPTAHVEANAPKPERTPNGRFARGNAGGPGNPFGRKVAQFRQALLSTITDDDIQRVGKLLLEMALARDVAAMKLFLQYAVGKPQVVVEPDRVDIDEWELVRQSVVRNDIAEETFASMPITVGIATLPALAEVRERQFADMMLHPENYPTPNADDEPTAEELAEDAEMLREYRAAQAAEQAEAEDRAAALSVNHPAEPTISAAAPQAAARIPADVRQPAGNAQRPSPLSANATAADATLDIAGAPLPNGKNRSSRRTAPSAGDASRGGRAMRSAG